jgi:acyl-CoA synthetase (NDP forming)
MIIGVVHDPLFGPVVACGAGGTLVELIKDVAIRLTPLTQEDAADMVRSLKTYPLLTGYRGRPPCDVGAIPGEPACHCRTIIEAGGRPRPSVADPRG